VPVSDAAKSVVAGEAGALELVLTGGDDYEIICTVPNEKTANFRAAAKAAGVLVTEIGEIRTGEGAQFIDAAGKPLAFKRASFSHF
jgi:thiamine-monophosphate kinase